MKRINKSVVFVIMALLCVLTISVSAKTEVLGDVDLNGSVDMNDAVLLLQHSLFPDIITIGYTGSVDFTNDGEVDMNDAIFLLQHSMFPDLFPLVPRYTITFYDLGIGTSPVGEIKNVNQGTFGGYPEYELWYEPGYKKSDNELFDDYLEDDDGYVHKLDYEWYYKDENDKFVKYDESTEVTSDLDVYAKIKRIDVVVKIPESIMNTDEVLIFNAPYDADSRYIDLWRDAFSFNRDQVVSKFEETLIENKMNEKLQEEGVGYFGDGGALNEDFEINKTDFIYSLDEMLGESEALSSIMTSDGTLVINSGNISQAKSVMDAIYDVATAEAIIRTKFGTDGADSLIDRLPMHILEELYDERVQEYLKGFEKAVSEVEGGEEEKVIDGGIYFNIDLVEELLLPMFDYVKSVYSNAVERVSGYDSGIASLVKTYHTDNPYATSFVDGYMEPELFIEDEDGDGLYTVKSLPDRYDNVLMPLKVETADALLWFTEQVDFEDVKEIISNEDNKEIGLALTNRVNRLLDGYFDSGLPNDIVEYYKDLTSDGTIASAVEMLDCGEEFDMEFFVETTISYKLCEMLYMTILRDLGVSDSSLLGYNDTAVYTEKEYDDFVERMEITWNSNYTTDMGIDYMIEQAGGEGDVAEISFGGLTATLIRSTANSMFD